MALALIDYPASLVDQTDFSAHGDLIEAGYWDKVNSPLLVRDGVIPQGAVLQVGGVIYHGTSDTAITGTASDYVRITAAGASATADYVATLTGVEWSKQYNGYYDGEVPARLYLFDEGKALAAGAIAAVFGRYLAQQATGDVAIGRDLAVKRNETVGGTLGVTGAATVGGTLGVTGAATAATVTARGFDTFGGFHQGTGADDLNLPIGSVILVDNDGFAVVDRNQTREIRAVGFSGAGYTVGTGTSQLLGTWRSRGAFNPSGTTAIFYLFQRTA